MEADPVTILIAIAAAMLGAAIGVLAMAILVVGNDADKKRFSQHHVDVIKKQLTDRGMEEAPADALMRPD